MAGTYCYAHGHVDAGCVQCPPRGFPQADGTIWPPYGFHPSEGWARGEATR